MPVRGLLNDMDLPTMVQWACQQGNRARLNIQRGTAEATLYFAEGSIVHAHLHPGGDEEELSGDEVIYRILGWEDGSFVLETGVDPPARSVLSPWTSLLVEGLHRQDDEQPYTVEIDQIRSDSMAARATSDILKEFLDVPGISSAVVVGRDGFVIEASGGSRTLNLDALGASLAHAINGIERMGKELQINVFQDLIVEYGDSLIIARPVGDAVIALVAPDASQLGIIRYMSKPLVKELASFF